LAYQKRLRVAIGGLLALGMLAAVPTAAMAAQPSCGDTLMTNTTLTADLDCSGYGGTALTMGANGIVLNLNGHTLWGPSGQDNLYGVYSDEYDHTTIKNGKVSNFTYNIYLNGSNRTLVQNVEVTGETNRDYGVYIDYGVYNTLNDLNVHGVSTAVYANSGAKLTVKNSTLSGDPNDSDYGIGLYLYEETADKIMNNQFQGYYGVYDYESHRQSYSGNTANGNEYGMYLYCDTYGTVTVTGNTTNNNGSYGIYSYYCYAVDHPIDGFTGSRFTGNTANGNETGFYDYASYNALWRGNTANDNDGDGFYLDYPGGSRMVSNVALRNGDSGIEIADNYSWYNMAAFDYNTAKKNAYGLYAGYGVSEATGNVAKKNSTMNCYNVDC
jgi:parallel beta-helix repeat protein